MDNQIFYGAAHVAEIIQGRLYFITCETNTPPRSTNSVHYFSIDTELQYESFYSDFGPLNLAMLYRYCCMLNKKFRTVPRSKVIAHCTTKDLKKRVNAAFLIGSFSIIYLKRTPEEALRPLVAGNSPLYIPFRDASYGNCTYDLTLSDCLYAIHKAITNNFLDFKNFDYEEYEFYERVENGDLNWIVPKKFIAFCGPHSKGKFENGYLIHPPESYFSYFRKANVTTIIRLNKKIYDANRFKNNGFDHWDLFFVDGTTPTDEIMENFLHITEEAKGVIAVHCKAGLGRTGTLIACYIMKHHDFTASEAIAWIRICRPGSIIGNQQHWLEVKQTKLCFQKKIIEQNENANAKNNNYKSPKSSPKAFAEKCNVTAIVAKVDQLQLSDKANLADPPTRGRRSKIVSGKKTAMNNVVNGDDNNNNDGENLTQGDELNRIKALRRQPRSLTTGGVNLDHLKPHQRSSSQPYKALATNSTAANTNYMSPLKPLRASGVQPSPSNSPTASPTAGSSVRHSRKITPTSSPTKRRHWRHVGMSPQNTAHRTKWDFNFLDSSLNNVPNTSSTTSSSFNHHSSPPSHSCNLNITANTSPCSMNLRTRSAVLQHAEGVRNSNTHLMSNDRSGHQRSKSPATR